MSFSTVGLPLIVPTVAGQCLLERDKRTPGLGDGASPAGDESTGVAHGGIPILCGFCGHAITNASSRVQVAGSHDHTFANPHGIVYKIGCFGSAPGCHGLGAESSEFAWFAGHSWTVQVCGRCGQHLGWSFRSAAQHFYGLILERLVEAPGPEEHD